MSVPRPTFTTATLWLAASTSSEVSNVSVWTGTGILGQTTSIDKEGSASNAFLSTAITGESVNTRTDKKYACK